MSDKTSNSEKGELPEASSESRPVLAINNEDNPDQLKAWSPTAFKLYAILMVTFMGSLGWGFDCSVVSSVNGMIQFTDYFHIGGGDTGGGQGIITAMLYSIFSIGCIAGSFVTGPIVDSARWGRRGAMFIGSILILAGVSTVTAAQSRIYLFFGRFLIGFGSVINNCASNAYVSELAPPQVQQCASPSRIPEIGSELSTASGFIGSIVASSMPIGTGRLASSWSWRLPFAVQLVPAVFMLSTVWFIPESPRWLMSVGRKEDAHAVLAEYHGNGNPNAQLVLLEIRELEEYIKVRPQRQSYWRESVEYSKLFNSRSAFYRTILTCWLGVCCLWSGTGLFYYITVLFDMAGVKTQEGRLTLSSVATVLGALGALLGSLIVDKVGRRKLWICGASACSILLVLSAVSVAKEVPPAAITFLLLFSIAHYMVYTPLQGMYISECLSFDGRAKGLALVGLMMSLAAIVNNFAGSVAFEKIGWRYILVPASYDALQAVITWLIAVETKGRTLYVICLTASG
ncbi:MFS lactose [Mycena chlorophos]|uniref:MFS lactose n=1 Tax=Mycena chlorophos TaxID=658473 RepID=A0A8H6VR26_MYCCL|nr:MFS lactose [Mycena chlorophos]